MSERLRYWLDANLKKRRWSQRKLSRQSGVSQPLISQVLQGDVVPSADFCIKVAQALEEPPEKLLRLAGLISSVETESGEDPPELAEITDLARLLSPSKRDEVLRYLRFLHHDKD